MRVIKRIGIVLLLILIVFSITFSGAVTLSPSEIDIANKDSIKYYYDGGVITGLEQKNITENVRDSGIAAEYRVAYDLSFIGVYYYDLQVYRNGTGKFTFMVHHGEFNVYTSEELDTGKLLIDEHCNINKDDTDMLLKSINDNDFWNITTNNKTGLDGRGLFIEGYSNGKEHFIFMWEPGKEKGIYKIYKTFDEYSTKVEENPLRKIEQQKYDSE